MKKHLGLFLTALFLGVLGGIAIGIPVGQRVFEKNFVAEIPNPLVSLGNEETGINFFFNGDIDEKLKSIIYDVGEAFYSQFLPAIERFRKDNDDTQLLILKARINGDKQTEYRLLMRSKWLKDMMVPPPSKRD